MLITGWEGTAEDVERRRSISARILRKGGAVSLGQAPGKAWAHGRFEGPYLRDELMSLGYFVETLETSHTWSRYHELYDAVRSGLRRALEAAGHAGHRHVPPLARLRRRRVPLLHLHRAFQAGRPRSSTGARSRPPPARRSSPPAARSPTTTPWGATTLPTCRPRWARSDSPRSARSRSDSTRPGS